MTLHEFFLGKKKPAPVGIPPPERKPPTVSIRYRIREVHYENNRVVFFPELNHVTSGVASLEWHRVGSSYHEPSTKEAAERLIDQCKREFANMTIAHTIIHPFK